MNYIYLHGFCSGVNSNKGKFFKKKFSDKNIFLHIPDLNNGDFEHLTITNQLHAIEKLSNTLNGDITLIGSSLGGYLAALYAQENTKVKKLILMAPAFQFISRHKEKMGNDFIRQWKESGSLEIYHFEYKENRQLHFGIVEDAQQYDEKKLTRNIPTLILHGIRDDSVSYKVSIDYLKVNTLAHLVLLNSDHSLIDNIDLIWKYTEQFLQI